MNQIRILIYHIPGTCEGYSQETGPPKNAITASSTRATAGSSTTITAQILAQRSCSACKKGSIAALLPGLACLRVACELVESVTGLVEKSRARLCL